MALVVQVHSGYAMLVWLDASESPLFPYLETKTYHQYDVFSVMDPASIYATVWRIDRVQDSADWLLRYNFLSLRFSSHLVVVWPEATTAQIIGFWWHQASSKPEGPSVQILKTRL